MKTTPCGIKVFSSPLIGEGTYVYTRDGKIHAISSAKRRAWLAQFGLDQEIAPGFDAVTLSPVDYEALTKDESLEVPFQ